MENYQLRPRYILAQEGKGKIRIFSESKSITINCSNSKVEKWILNLPYGSNVEDLQCLRPCPEISKLLNVLKSKKLVREKYVNQFVGTRFEKHIDYFAEHFNEPNNVQKEIFCRRVLIVGLGGVGNIVVQHLIGLGITNFIFVDFDDVRIDNFNRQFMFMGSDLGEKKIDALKNKIINDNVNANIECLHLRINDDDELANLINGEVDLIVCAADTPPVSIRKYLISIALQIKSPIVFADVGFDVGSWGPFLTEKNSKEEYINKLEKTENLIKNLQIKNISMSIGYSNSLISTLLSMDITNFFLDLKIQSLNKIKEINFNTLKVSTRDTIL